MIRTIGHMTMAALLLLSSAGVALHMHLCHDRIVDMALMAPAQSCCGDEMPGNDCHGDDRENRSHHCEDQSITFETAGDYLVTAYSYDLSLFQSINLSVHEPLMLAGRGGVRAFSSASLHLKRPPVPPKVALSDIQVYLI